MNKTTFTPLRQRLHLDVMVNDRYYTTISMQVASGMQYTLRELRNYAQLRLPSLKNKQFEVIPTANPVRN